MSANIAIVGATGAVGQEFLTVLAERRFPIKSGMKLLASARSAGKTVDVPGQAVHDRGTDQRQLQGRAGRVLLGRREHQQGVRARRQSAAGAVVVDNTSYFRMKDGIPLVVPEVNPEQIHKHNGIIANPNCSTIIMNVAVWPLYKANRVKRVIVSTYQAVSGAGAQGLHDLEQQIKAYASGQPINKELFPHQIVNNLFSHNTRRSTTTGYNEEEMKMVNETRKIFADPKIMVTATCIRVPIPRAHCESINLEFERPITPEEVRRILSQRPPA